MTAPDYRRIAEQAVSLLCSVGCYGLDRSRERELWQRALDLDRQLHPHRRVTTVWTEEEGDIDPPRHADGKPVPVGAVDGEGVLTEVFAEPAPVAGRNRSQAKTSTERNDQ
jgi:hypothetical protein